MAAVMINTGKKIQEFTRKSDGKKLSLTIDFGDTDKYAGWLDKLKAIQEIDTDNSSETMRKFKPLMRDLVTMLFGRFAWGRIFRFCEGNVFAVGEIIKAVSEVITVSMKEYGQK